MSKNKLGMFGILAFGVMMLLIPATSIVNAQEYDRYYEGERYYEDNDEYTYEDYYYPSKDKKKEPPMLIVKKDVLYCDIYSNSGQECFDSENNRFFGPDSDRYLQTCTATMNSEGEVCDKIDEEAFKMIVTDNIEFPGSEDGTKINFDGEKFTVTEDVNVGRTLEGNVNSCLTAGFDGGIEVGLDNTAVTICTLHEGDCSGFLQDGQQKECTVKNYVVRNGG